jgi:hypothetical protein
MKKIFVTASIAVALYLSIPVAAYAQQDEIFPGIACKPIGVNTTLSTRISEFYIVNLGEMMLPVACPIVSESFAPGNAVHVSVFASAPRTSSIRCEVFGTFTHLGLSALPDVTIFARNRTTSEGEGPNNPVLLFLEIAVPITVNRSLREYTLVCNLPTGGRIYRYIFSTF